MTFETLISYVACIFSLTLAIFVLRRDAKSLVHRIFAIGMAGLGAEAVTISMNFHYPFSLHLQELRLTLGNFISGVWLVFSLIYGRSNYREYLSRWKWLLLIAFTLPLILLILFNPYLFYPEALGGTSSYPLFPLNWAGQLMNLIALGGYILILMNLEKTLRSSVGIMRWQIKFAVLGLGVLFAIHIYTISQTALYRVLSPDFDLIKVGGVIFCNILILRSLFRTKLLNADLYISQSIIQNSITILVVGVYFIIVGVLAQISIYLGGDQRLPLKVFFIFLAAAGVGVLTFSDRFRREIKLFVSRNFHRPVHDYRREWTRFTGRTASLSKIEELCQEIVKMVSETFSALAVSLWLSDDKSGMLGLRATTAFPGDLAAHPKKWEREMQGLAEIMEKEKDPVDLEMPESGWERRGPELAKEFLKENQIRYAISIRVGEQFLGVLTMGSRVAGDLLSIEDFDLLRTIADQTAISIRQLKLAEELKTATEVESFQTLSSFVVHDLKNVASTLSLTLHNMPSHFDNPEFRRDATAMIDKSLNKIQTICTGLSSLGQKMEIAKKNANINETAIGAIKSLNSALKSKITRNLQEIPNLPIDTEQIQKILINLILNADEATAGKGEICVETARRDGWAVLAIRDNGCGMSKEFMEKSLFRPFRTTKKQGMGIGLFQSKMIVEAHGGRIEVESEEGVGTTFRVLLPIK